VFEPKTRNQDQDEFSNLLLAHTSLETSVGVNLVMIGSDGKPRQKALGDIIFEWIGFRFHTVTRRTQHRLSKVDDRIHILEGRQTVLLNIDKVIKIIRESDEPKEALIKAFKLSDRQAEDILEIRLRQLARLEAIKIKQELKELKEEKATLQDLLDNPASMKKLLIKEIEGDAKLYGDARRTLIEEAERAVAEQKLIDDPVTVIISQKGWVRSRNGHGHDAQQFSFKTGDGLYGAFECRTTDHVLAFGSNGRVYSISVAQLPGARGDGVPLTTFVEVEAGTRLVSYFAGTAETQLMLSSTGGYGFSAKAGDMISRQKGGKSFMSMDAEHEPLMPRVIAKNANTLVCLSENGRALVFGMDEIKTQGSGGRGVILMDLDKNEKLLAAEPINRKSGVIVSGLSSRAGKPQEVELVGPDLSYHNGTRARKGKLLATRMKANRLQAKG
jgi:topoisomerase-4 subunit A